MHSNETRQCGLADTRRDAAANARSMTQHRVLGLVSGGKDSAYAMMKCVEHGHEIIALGNLHPPSSCIGEELDSFMYQTVGHPHVQAMADAMELPLYRREICGTAVATGLQYDGAVAGDEVEDLHALLAEVLRREPGVTAVCCGAVLSNYQRARVESVCARLGLASLAYLWQRDQAELLAEMVDAGVVAVLIKVAALGLKPAHLGRTVGELQPLFHKLHGQFGFHVCGEGGEYETYTLDCPLFKRAIQVHGPTLTETGGGVAALSYDSATLVEKEPAAAGGGADVGGPATDDDADTVAVAAAVATAAISGAEWSLRAEPVTAQAPASELSGGAVHCVELGGATDEDRAGIFHLAAYGGGDGGCSAEHQSASAGGGAAAQLKTVLSEVDASLQRLGLSLDSVLFVRLYVASLAESVGGRFPRLVAWRAPLQTAGALMRQVRGDQRGVQCGLRGPHTCGSLGGRAAARRGAGRRRAGRRLSVCARVPRVPQRKEGAARAVDL